MNDDALTGDGQVMSLQVLEVGDGIPVFEVDMIGTVPEVGHGVMAVAGFEHEGIGAKAARQSVVAGTAIEPGADNDYYSHDGAEAGLVISGRLDLWIGDNFFTLNAGDNFSFRSTEAHRCANSGAEAVKVVWVITPPHY